MSKYLEKGLSAIHELNLEQTRDEILQKRLAGASDAVVIVCDVSTSMDEHAGALRKIDILRDALKSVVLQYPGARILAFSSAPQWSSANLPEPSGGTALHLALRLAATLRPAGTVVLSDGEPDNDDMALEAAEQMTGKIDVIYCGPDSNKKARNFMYRLARRGGGTAVQVNLAQPQQLVGALRRGLPPAKT